MIKMDKKRGCYLTTISFPEFTNLEGEGISINKNTSIRYALESLALKMKNKEVADETGE